MNTSKRVLRAVSTHWNLHGYAPSSRDIQEAIGAKSVGSVSYHVRELRRRGFLVSEPDTERTLRLTLEGVGHLEGVMPLVPLARLDRRASLLELLARRPELRDIGIAGYLAGEVLGNAPGMPPMRGTYGLWEDSSTYVWRWVA